MPWLLLILSLPTSNATARMRAWRALKAAGAAVLRDGVYLLPAREDCAATFDLVAREVRAAAGVAHVMPVGAPEGTVFETLFDRSADYAALVGEVERERVTPTRAADAVKAARRLRKAFSALAAIDYFAGEAQRQAEAAVSALERAAARTTSPGEPGNVGDLGDGVLGPLRLADYKRRVWATRSRPWADRLACAWLIRRHIDRKARIVWFARPSARPRDAVGFDYDGAEFSHVGARVTFEVMLARFGLEQPALLKLGAIIHALDVGGIQPPEAEGVERVLAGLRDTLADDDKLLVAAGTVFDGLVAAFERTP